MPLAVGTRIGPYEIAGSLGAGGMGEVYRARDTRLDRTVAIKVLPAGSAWEADARARFEREAWAISQLNHPHICTLLDVGRHGDVEFIVLEYLDGETLATRISRGPLPVGEALAIGTQIADALDAAHRRGIVHRDLKPANVMLVRTGSAKGEGAPAKLLDFGLAKSIAGQAATTDTVLATATTAPPLTSHGMVLGTVPYMAPEQVEGQEADARSDLWALGCVLFEMLTGRRAFEASTPAGVAAAILEREVPEITAAAPHVSPALAHLVARCLERDRDARWQTASDVKRELQWLRRQPSDGASTDTTSRTVDSRRPERRAWLRGWRSIAALAFGVGGLAVAAWISTTPAPAVPAPEVSSLSITLPDSITDVRPPNASRIQSVAISPDDVHVAFNAMRGSVPVIYLRRLDSFEVREVPGGGEFPFFSGDGQSLAFVRGGEVWRTPVATLAPVRIGLLPMALWNVRGVTWHARGDLLFSTDRGLYRMPAGGGESEIVVRPDVAARQVFRELSLLPDDRVLAAMSDASGDHLVLVEPTTWQIRVLDGQPAGRLAGGWLFSRTSSGLVASRFDHDRLRVVGEPIAVAGAAFGGGVAFGVAALSRGGSMAAFVTTAVPRFPRYVDRTGRDTALPRQPAEALIRWPRLSPSGRRLAFGFNDTATLDPTTLRVFDLATGAVTALPQFGATEPVWLPDESAVITSGGEYPRQGLFRQPIDGRQPRPVGATTEFERWPTSISRRGELLYYVGNREEVEDLYVLDLGTDRVTRIPQPGMQRGGRFSPDGRWIAYESTVSGIAQVEVVSWPDLAVRRHVSSDGGTEPIWSTDQREIFYRNGDKVMAARVLPGPDLTLAPPVELFSRPFEHDPAGDQSWDLAPDGRFLMLEPTMAPRLEVRVVRRVVALLDAVSTRR